MLFLIYINDLPTQLERSCAIFADDTTVHAASSDSKLSCARISTDLDVAAEWADNWGMLFSAEKSEHLDIGKATGQRVTMTGVSIPQVKHHRHLGLVMNNKLSWTEHIKDVYGTCSRIIGVLRRLHRRLQGTVQSRQFSSVPFDHAWNMRPKFGVEDPLKAYKDYKINFARNMGFTCLRYRLDSTITLWFCSTRWDQVLYRHTYAHFFPGEFQQLQDIHFESQGTQSQPQENHQHWRAFSHGR